MKDSAISEHPAQRGLRFAAMVVAALLAGCSQKQAAPPRPAAPVTVAMVGERDIPLDITAIGNVEPVQTVQIRSMVNGQVDEVLFKEGQEVRKGDLLFKLDQRPFLADLDRNIAMLHKDEAQAANSQTQSVRYDALEKQGVISKELGDQQRTQARADASLVNSDKAAVEASRVQLQYSEIRSPIDAKTGSLLVTKGNLVKANDTPYLVQLNQIAPIYATFTVPETELATVKEYAAARRKVLAFAKGETSNPPEGILTFIDNMVDTSTGTVKLKATFENKDRRLWPGEFVDVALNLSTQKNAIIIPSTAVQTGQQGQYVYVIKPDNTAESRFISVGRTYQNVSVVTKGLNPGERVVVDGQLRLAPNMKVEVTNTVTINPTPNTTPANANGV